MVDGRPFASLGQPAGGPTDSSPQAVSTEGAHQAQGFIVRPYSVAVGEFGCYTYIAASRGKALADAWRAYTGCYNDVSFKDFLRIARCWKAHWPAPFGDGITVGGAPAFFVSKDRQYVQFVRPGSDVVMNSHPYDVEPEQYRSEPYRDHQAQGRG